MNQIPTVSVAGVPDPLPQGLVVLDVRDPAEWQHGHVEGAVHIPLSLLPLRHTELPSAQMLVVCRVGGRSAQAVAWLQRQGRDAVNLSGGLVEWEAAGRALVSETGRPPQVV
ncbi:rhodanese-like domain-containing protein [Nocardioides sp.]|uniref:rhodanese-like domain-containing protein n=1 Tax=Nocardioides sp. TaxID=35761 RepID=UPI002EDA00FE